MLRKFLGAAVVAIGVVATAGASQAATLGSLSLSLTNGLFVNADANGGQSISADYVFSNTLPGGDVLAQYDISAALSINGSSVFGGTLPLGVVTLNEIENGVNFLIAPLTVSDVATFLASLPSLAGTTINLFGADIDVDLFTFTGDASGGSGSFLFSSPDDENYFDFIEDILDNGGPVSAEFAASASLTASVVPVPAALPLLGSGILLLGFVARRRRAA